MNEIAQSGTNSALSRRESQVLELLIEGCSLADVASRLDRSEKTIQKHRDAIYRKLDVRNRMQLAREAVKRGLAPGLTGDSAGVRGWALLQAIETRLDHAHRPERLAEAITRAFDMPHGGIVAIKPMGGAERVVTSRWDGRVCDRMPPAFIRLETVRQGAVAVHSDAARRSGPAAAHEPIESFAGVRLGNEVDPVGILWVASDRPMSPRLPALEILRVYGRAVGVDLAR